MNMKIASLFWKCKYRLITYSFCIIWQPVPIKRTTNMRDKGIVKCVCANPLMLSKVVNVTEKHKE